MVGIRGIGAAAVLAIGAGAACGQGIAAQWLTGSLSRPVYVTAAPGDTERIFVVERRGVGGVAGRAAIRIFNLETNTLEPEPFLTVEDVGTGFEQGLVCMAFDPGYATNGFFYIAYTEGQGGTSKVMRYQVSAADPNLADPTTPTEVITITEPFADHNVDWLGFGPDGYLYITKGDGGNPGMGDPEGRAQNLEVLHGKVLRIDVSTLPYTIPPDNPFATATLERPEIWAYGLRNPWRASFDRATGDFWLTDVGQTEWEEVNYQPAITTPPFAAVNYGWRCYEGPDPYNLTGCASASTMTFPIHAYDHSNNHCSVIGGYVYRGCAIPELRGKYIFAEWCTHEFWSFRYDGTAVTEMVDHTLDLRPASGPQPFSPQSFGEDAAGELYFVDSANNLFKIVPRCAANCDGSTETPVLNVADFTCYLQQFAAGDCWANCDDSTQEPVLNVADFTCFLQAFAAGCP